MSLPEEIIDALQKGIIGQKKSGYWIVERREIMENFPRYSESYKGCFLSNSEKKSAHSPTYTKFTKRIKRGLYEIRKP
jgi:hypothetical protein